VHKGSALGTQRYAVEQARQAADRADDAAIQCHADAATQTGQGTVAPLMPLSCVTGRCVGLCRDTVCWSGPLDRYLDLNSKAVCDLVNDPDDWCSFSEEIERRRDALIDRNCMEVSDSDSDGGECRVTTTSGGDEDEDVNGKSCDGADKRWATTSSDGDGDGRRLARDWCTKREKCLTCTGERCDQCRADHRCTMIHVTSLKQEVEEDKDKGYSVEAEGWRSLEAIIGWRGLAEGWQSLGAEMEPGQVWPNLI
jgi:hypothetical protein